ncbi:hypothetical protein BKA67DRAFT_541854 [Truncatella angustata]|uniref:Uncharacterized protein n=1 Tax=Truncatella angustata TaxID=152316 RepID=A0A9P8RM02_9PEZI|nr:uncharacterized protein BKA67DRAFT_541854 [Truncatella angustata]KAH6645685.1 hypothetical protein BKA67DRAFT_541854 [Truncatella angustata]
MSVGQILNIVADTHRMHAAERRKQTGQERKWLDRTSWILVATSLTFIPYPPAGDEWLMVNIRSGAAWYAFVLTATELFLALVLATTRIRIGTIVRLTSFTKHNLHTKMHQHQF